MASALDRELTVDCMNLVLAAATHGEDASAAAPDRSAAESGSLLLLALRLSFISLALMLLLCPLLLLLLPMWVLSLLPLGADVADANMYAMMCAMAIM